MCFETFYCSCGKDFDERKFLEFHQQKCPTIKELQEVDEDDDDDPEDQNQDLKENKPPKVNQFKCDKCDKYRVFDLKLSLLQRSLKHKVFTPFSCTISQIKAKGCANRLVESLF